MNETIKISRPSTINEPYLQFFDTENNVYISDIWKKLEDGAWRELNIENFLYNSLLPSCKLHLEKPLFPSIQQIQPGTKWDSNFGGLMLDLYTPKYREPKRRDFLNICHEYFQSLNAHKIGVHLSGGLDSSLIMCILHELNIPFVAIGMQSDTYEFRTERKIQEILIKYASDGELLSFQDYPFYSGLTELPKHQIPDSHIKSFTSASAMATAFKMKGCDVVLTGQGGDSLFVNAIDDFTSLKFNISDEFDNLAECHRFYSKFNIRLLSFFAHRPIIDFICSARIGQSDDPLKKWARNWFKGILPYELSNYTYCADYFGLSMHGLEIAKPTIAELMANAFRYSSHSLFSKRNIQRFINQDVFSFEYTDYIKFCSLISVAVWYHSLFRKDE